MTVSTDCEWFSNIFLSPLRKRVIAWERSRAASGYGIIWGDADRNKQEEFSAESHSADCFQLTELQIAIRSRLLFSTTKSQENCEELERRVWLFIWTIVRYCKYTRECGRGEMTNK